MTFIGQTTASVCEGFPTLRELIPSPYSGCAGGLVAPKLVISFAATKPPAQPEDGDVISSRNVGKPLHTDVAVRPRKFYWFLLFIFLIVLMMSLCQQKHTAGFC